MPGLPAQRGEFVPPEKKIDELPLPNAGPLAPSTPSSPMLPSTKPSIANPFEPNVTEPNLQEQKPDGGQPPPPPLPPPPPGGAPNTPMAPAPGGAGEPAKPGAADPGKEPEQPKAPEWPKYVGGRTVEEWLSELRYSSSDTPYQPDSQIRETAIKSLVFFGPDELKKVTKPIMNAILYDTDPGVQTAGITIISSMGYDQETRKLTRAVVETLQRKLGSETTNSIVKMYCVRSLASFGHDAVSSIPYLNTYGKRDRSWETRREVAIALGIIGSPPPPEKPGDPIGEPNATAMDVLIDNLLLDRTAAVRMEAAKSLLTIGPPRPKDPTGYAKAVQVFLTKIKPRIEFEGSTVPKGTRVNIMPNKNVYIWLLLLEIMYDDRTLNDNVEKIAALIQSPDDPFHRLNALQALGAMGEKAAGAVPQITEALNYKEPELQMTAMMALARMGKKASVAVPKLQEISKVPPVIPKDAPKGYIPDDTLQKMALETIEYINGTKNFDAPPPAPKNEGNGKQP
jgi:HEAT repeat protein